MAGVTRAHPVIGALTGGPFAYSGKDITILNVNADVDFDGSVEATIALVNTIQRYGNILIQGVSLYVYLSHKKSGAKKHRFYF